MRGTPPLITLHLWRVPPRRVPAALARVAGDRAALARTGGLGFAKLLGTSDGHTFDPRDADLTRWALLAVWDSPTALATFERTSPVARGWARLAEERFRADLWVLASRGRWSGVAPFDAAHHRPAAGAPAAAPASGEGAVPAWQPPERQAAGGQWQPPERQPPERQATERQATERQAAGGQWQPPAEATASRWPGPAAALTRARLRPGRMRRFWAAVPPVAAALADAPGLRLRLGIGEAPVGVLGTFSLWESTQALTDFAYHTAAHREAVRRTPAEGWYAEELFARFAVLQTTGTIGGVDPLAQP